MLIILLLIGIFINIHNQKVITPSDITSIGLSFYNKYTEMIVPSSPKLFGEKLNIKLSYTKHKFKSTLTVNKMGRLTPSYQELFVTQDKHFLFAVKYHSNFFSHYD